MDELAGQAAANQAVTLTDAESPAAAGSAHPQMGPVGQGERYVVSPIRPGTPGLRSR